MATEFVQTIKASGGDFPSLAACEAACQCALTSSLVFSHGGKTGTWADGDAITAPSGATGSVVGFTTDTQVLIESITGAFISGELLTSSSGGTLTIADSGDSPIARYMPYNFTDNVVVNISGGTSSSDAFIFVKPAEGEGHGGVSGDGYTLQVGSGGPGFSMGQTYTFIEGFTVRNSSGISVKVTANDTRINKIIASSVSSQCFSATGGARIVFENNRGEGGTVGAFVTRFIYSLMSNTMVDQTEYGFSCSNISANTVIKNNISAGAGIAGFDFEAGTEVASNASSDFSAPGVGAVNEVSINDGVDFVSPSTGDYQPTSDGKLAGTGINLTIEAGFSDDITGAERAAPPTAWDIGAYIAEGGVVGITINPDNINQGQTLGSVSLTQSWVIASNSLNQAQSIGSPTIAAAQSVTPGGLSQAQALETVALTQAYIITINDLAQAQTLGSPTLTAAGNIAPDQLNQAQSIEPITLTQAGLLTAAGITQGQLLAEVALTQASNINPAGLAQAQNIDPVSLLSAAQLAVDGIAQAQRIGSVSLAIAGAIAANNIRQAQSIEPVTLTQAGAITVQDLSQYQNIGEVELIQGYAVQVASLLQGQALESVSLTLGTAIVSPDRIDQTQTLGSPTLEEFAVIQANDLTQAQLLDVVRFGGVVIGELEGKLVLYSLLTGNLVLH